MAKINDLVGRYFYNYQSLKVYKCISVKASMDDPMDSEINLEQLGSKKAFSFSFDKFAQSYRAVEKEELELIEKYKDRISNLTESITLEWLRNPPKEEESNLGFIYVPTERDDFKNLVIYKDVQESINIGLKKIELKDFLNNDWNLKSIEPMDGRCALNFWGPPGTGKTASVRAIAKLLDKKLYQVNYSQIISKWVGDTAKHISEVFAAAKKANAILFFDEADSMLSRRVNMAEGDQSFATSINQNRNVLMQEIDKFNGVLVFATNFFGNYDEAMLRRIAQHVEFKLPDAKMREDIFERHIPKEVSLHESFSLVECAKLSEGFSGGDIKNACLNAIIAAAMDDIRILRQSHLVQEINKIKSSKKNHSKKGINKRPIGLEVEFDE